METPAELVCARCQKPFTTARREWRRQVKKGRTQFFCGLSCHATARNVVHSQGNPENLLKGKVCDEHSPFRWFMCRVRYRVPKKGATDLTIEALRTLWDEQAGTCPLTGWLMTLPPSTSGFDAHSPRNASLDRIDNTKGYVMGNVRFICMMANIARCDFDDEQVIAFCKAVASRTEPR